MDDLARALGSHLAATSLIQPGQRVVAGYSGGPDSTFLLDALAALEFDVVAAHLHHGQRPEADDEMARCEAFAAKLGVPFAGGRADVPKMARGLKIGLEEAGRRARYEFLQRVSLKYDGDVVATGHTLDDHVETVILNLARGSGLAGLGGIPARRGNIVRPCLWVGRAETRAYCVRRGLWFHDDPANEDPAFGRTLVRQRVLPELEALNPAFQKAVSRLASVVTDEDAYLDALAVDALSRGRVPLNGNLEFVSSDCEAAFDRAGLGGVSPVLLRRGIRLVSAAFGAVLDYPQTMQIVEGILFPSKSSCTAEGGEVVAEWDSETIHFRRLHPDVPARYPLSTPGVTVCEGFGWIFEVLETGPEDCSRAKGALEATLDRSAIKGELHLRLGEPGERLTPLGMTGTRKIADLLSEAGLTQTARRRLPLICDMTGPVWVPGICLAERARIRETSQRALKVRFGPQCTRPDAPDAT